MAIAVEQQSKPRTGEREAGSLVVVHFLLAVGVCASSGFLRTGSPTEWLALACVSLAALLWFGVYCRRALPGTLPFSVIAAFVLLCFSLGQPFFLWRMVHHQAGPLALAMRLLAAGATALVFAYVLMPRTRWRGTSASHILFLLLAGIALLLRVLIVADSPDPGTDPERFFRSWATDIYSSTDGGAARFLHGQNPYTGSYPPWIAPGRGMFNFYVYPPGYLLLSLPGKILGGDVRYSYALAMLVAALLMYRLGRGLPGRERELLTLLLLYHPRMLYLHEQAFTEPISAAAALWMALAVCEGRRASTGAALALLITTKQYGITFLPALLRARGGRRTWGAAGAVLAAILLPFALWNGPALWQNLVMFHMRLMPRYEGLNWVTAVYRLTGIKVAALLPLAVLSAAGILWKQRPGAAAFLGSGSLMLLGCFLFGRYAFFNYYWLAGVLVLAHAAVILREMHNLNYPSE